MTEREYKKLLIDMVSIGDYKDKEEVISLLKLCNVAFEKTAAFAYSGIWDQRKEYIYLSIIPDRLVQLKSHAEYVKTICNDIYPVSDEYMLADVFFKPGTLTDYEEVSQEVYDLGCNGVVYGSYIIQRTFEKEKRGTVD